MKKALTLIELIIVIVTLGTLMALGFELVRQAQLLQEEDYIKAQLEAELDGAIATVASAMRAAIPQSVRTRTPLFLLAQNGDGADFGNLHGRFFRQNCLQLSASLQPFAAAGGRELSEERSLGALGNNYALCRPLNDVYIEPSDCGGFSSGAAPDERTCGAAALEMALIDKPWGQPAEALVESRCAALAQVNLTEFVLPGQAPKATDPCYESAQTTLDGYIARGFGRKDGDKTIYVHMQEAGKAVAIDVSDEPKTARVFRCFAMRLPDALKRANNLPSGESALALDSCNTALLHQSFLMPSDLHPDFTSGDNKMFTYNEDSITYEDLKAISSDYGRAAFALPHDELHGLSPWYGFYFRSDKSSYSGTFIEEELYPSRLVIGQNSLADEWAHWDIFFLPSTPAPQLAAGTDRARYGAKDLTISSALDIVKFIRYFELVHIAADGSVRECRRGELCDLVGAKISYHDFIAHKKAARISGVEAPKDMVIASPFLRRYTNNSLPGADASGMANQAPRRQLSDYLAYAQAGHPSLIASNISKFSVQDIFGVRMIKLCMQKSRPSARRFFTTQEADRITACRSEVI